MDICGSHLYVERPLPFCLNSSQKGPQDTSQPHRQLRITIASSVLYVEVQCKYRDQLLTLECLFQDRKLTREKSDFQVLSLAVTMAYLTVGSRNRFFEKYSMYA
jgi:hypothetical protein